MDLSSERLVLQEADELKRNAVIARNIQLQSAVRLSRALDPPDQIRQLDPFVLHSQGLYRSLNADSTGRHDK